MTHQINFSLNVGLTFLAVFIFRCSVYDPCLTFAQPLLSAGPLPCKADINCELGTYCSSNKCIPCTDCTIYHRNPKPDGGRQCAMAFRECGGCMPGFAFKEESGGMYSRRCFPLNSVYPELAATSPTTTASSTVSESPSDFWIGIIVGCILLALFVVACVVVASLYIRRRCRSPKSTNNSVEHVEYHQQPPTAPYFGDDHPPAYDDSSIMGNRATEPLLSVPEITQSFVTHITYEKERLNQAEVLQPPKYSRGHTESDEGELREDDDLGEEDAHSYGSAATVYPEDIDFGSHVDTFDYTEDGADSAAPLGDHGGIDIDAVVELPAAQLVRSRSYRHRLSQRAASDSALLHPPIQGISSLHHSSSQLDLTLGNYAGVHVTLRGHRGSLRSLHPAAEDSLPLPLPCFENLEARFEDAGFESSLGEANSSGTSCSSLPRTGAASFLASADSGILEEQHEKTANKGQTDQSSEETGPDNVEAPAKRFRRDLEDEVMSTILDVADLQGNVTYDDDFVSRSCYGGR